jgi:hypothetical protein
MEALLAPIPAIYIVEGESVHAKHGRVAYGSDAWELFNRLRLDGVDKQLPVLIYASATESSHLANEIALHKIVSSAVLDGFENSVGGKHRRPHLRTKRALETDSKFALFWEIVNLNRLSRPANLSSVRTLIATGKKGKILTEAPRGPIRIWVEDEALRKNL